ncbi:MAG: hypothetical protein ACOX1F_05180 [Erysipelotrichaceae bacterium]
MWDYLNNYPRYFSEKSAVDDCALVFGENYKLIFDFSFYKGEEYNYNFTELISFSNEADYLYKLEYENPYPDKFDNAIFYIELDPEDNTRFRFGRHLEGDFDYIELFADIGFTAEELFSQLNKYDAWVEITNKLYGYYFLETSDENQVSIGIMNSDFGITGNISEVEYHGYMSYTVSVDYPGYEGDEMTAPYEPYTADYPVYYNPSLEYLVIEMYKKRIEFAPDKGLTLEKFVAELVKYDSWVEADVEIGGYYLISDKDNRLYLGRNNKIWSYDGTVSKVEYNGYNSYSVTVDYPKEGNKDAYTIVYEIYFCPNSEILLIGIENQTVKFVPDIGLTADELFAEISKYINWIISDGYTGGYYFRAYDGNKFEIGKGSRTEYRVGTISKVIYDCNKHYIVTVNYPKEGNKDATTVEHSLYYYPVSEILEIEIDNKTIRFNPDKGLTFKEFVAYVGQYKRWQEHKDGGYFVQIYDGNKFFRGTLDSGDGFTGTISDFKYNGFTQYTITVDYPGYEGDELIDPYDPHTVSYEFYCNPEKNYLAMWYYGELVQFKVRKKILLIFCYCMNKLYCIYKKSIIVYQSKIEFILLE